MPTVESSTAERKTMKRIKYIWYLISSKRFWLHLFMAIALFVLLILGVFWYLDVYTHHGESVTVPPMLGMTLDEAREFMEGKDMYLKVIDSVYNPKLKPREIINQIPGPGSKVKTGRTIYITIRSIRPDMTVVPDVESLSLRNAVSKLENAGFQVGEKIYKPFKYPNTVMYLMQDDLKVVPGARYPKGTEFDLVVGSGLGQTRVIVPKLIGLTRRDAEAVLFGAYELNIGNLYYHESVQTAKDTLNARVYKQVPDSGATLRIGEFVDLYFISAEAYKFLVDTSNPGLPAIDSIPSSLDSINP